MKKIFLALCLLYLTLCEEQCEKENPSNVSECVVKTKNLKYSKCCYVTYRISSRTFSYCKEYSKESEVDQIKYRFKKTYGDAIILEDIFC